MESVEGAQVQPVVKEDPPAPVQEEARTPDPAPLALVEQQVRYYPSLGTSPARFMNGRSYLILLDLHLFYRCIPV